MPRVKPKHLCIAALFAVPLAGAQPAPESAASQPAPAPSAPPPGAPTSGERIVITGQRPDESEERRQSTAAKTVIGRDEIERQGDASLGQILQRLPGVTSQGAPGRGGAPRMRGLGGNYTQVLVDGQRLPAGASVDDLSPDQVERIEVYRAPTAETGARAIAGTINIITREGQRPRLNDLKLALREEHGRVSPNLAWARHGRDEALSYDLNASLYRNLDDDAGRRTTTVTSLDDGSVLSSEEERSVGQDVRTGLRAGGRLQWSLGEGESLTLSPFFIHSEGHGERDATLVGRGGVPPATASTANDNVGRYTLLRLNGQWRRRSDDGLRLEASANGWLSHWRSATTRVERDAAGLELSRVDDRSDNTERTLTLSGKAAKLLDNDHELVAGAELEGSRRHEDYRSALAAAGSLRLNEHDLRASSTRTAAWAQDEWQLTPQWAAHAGLRWEAIETRGESASGLRSNRSSVWTPLLHALWKPDPKSRDQVRVSLTRSYRSPSLSNLIGEPRTNLNGDNSATNPDRAGNPGLRPELSTGLDLAYEHWLPGGGVLSANLFQRRITDVIRTVVALETDPDGGPARWIARPRNVGDARTRGVELEAKFRLDQLWPAAWDEAPRVDLRSNASIYRSHLDGIPGPDNRLDEQPGLIANLGADWRLRGLPLTLGGSIGWTPGYTTRLSDTELLVRGDRRVIDAYALWAVNPSVALRLSASNLAARDRETRRSVDDLVAGTREVADNVGASYVGWQLRLEMKL